MRRRSTVSLLAVVALTTLFAGSIVARRELEKERGSESTLEEVLYLPSGKTLKRLSLGYSNLLADIYWTRAVQYFGARHVKHSQRYDLLYPLLDITTELDPQLIVAYEYGGVFLSQQPPDGAGQPDNAVILVQKGIRNNPGYWRLYFTLGFVHYIDRHDPRSAQAAFQRGSEIPGALPWMKVMAARMAERSKDIETSMLLWEGIAETTYDPNVKETARRHLVSLRADRDIQELERRAAAYRERAGVFPAGWADLVRAGLLNGIPLAPGGEPYVLHPEGKVYVQDPNAYPYLGEWRYNVERPF